MAAPEIRIPKYIIEILERSEFVLNGEKVIPGYTIRVEKKTPYAYATTLRDEAKKTC